MGPAHLIPDINGQTRFLGLFAIVTALAAIFYAERFEQLSIAFGFPYSSFA